MKALREGVIDLVDLQGRLHKERGIWFETCVEQNQDGARIPGEIWHEELKMHSNRLADS